MLKFFTNLGVDFNMKVSNSVEVFSNFVDLKEAYYRHFDDDKPTPGLFLLLKGNPETCSAVLGITYVATMLYVDMVVKSLEELKMESFALLVSTRPIENYIQSSPDQWKSLMIDSVDQISREFTTNLKDQFPKGIASFSVPANTNHCISVFDAFKHRVNEWFPKSKVLNICDETFKHVANKQLSDDASKSKKIRLAVLGTKMTMSEGGDFAFYKNAFSADDRFELVYPSSKDKDQLHSLIMNKLIKDESEHTIQNANMVLDIINRLQPLNGIILGCTELPLLMSCVENDIMQKYVFADTTMILAKALILTLKAANKVKRL